MCCLRSGNIKIYLRIHKGNYTVELKTNEKYQHIEEIKERSLTFSLSLLTYCLNKGVFISSGLSFLILEVATMMLFELIYWIFVKEKWNV